jgi:hypothetical protein
MRTSASTTVFSPTEACSFTLEARLSAISEMAVGSLAEGTTSPPSPPTKRAAVRFCPSNRPWNANRARSARGTIPNSSNRPSR